MCLLSALHMNCMRKIGAMGNTVDNDPRDIHTFYDKTKKTLNAIGHTDYDEGDAMAGLHVVSSFLFTGMYHMVKFRVGQS